jgi:putative endonuclease
MMITGNRFLRGKEGENAAADFLRGIGLKILERNFRCPPGEIDIIAKDEKTIVFVEVRGRRSDGHGHPEESITLSKRRRLTRAACWYLKQRGLAGSSARFDVIAVRWNGEEPELNWMVNAFEARF